MSSFGWPVGSFGSFWLPLGSPWAPFGRRLDSLWLSWDAFGPSSAFCLILDATFRATVAQEARLRTISSLPPATRGSPWKWCQELLLGPQLNTRWDSGQRELNKLPQINKTVFWLVRCLKKRLNSISRLDLIATTIRSTPPPTHPYRNYFF